MLALTEFLLLFVSRIPHKQHLCLADFSTMARLRCKGLIEKLIKGFIPDPPKGWECNKKPGLQNIHEKPPQKKPILLMEMKLIRSHELGWTHL